MNSKLEPALEQLLLARKAAMESVANPLDIVEMRARVRRDFKPLNSVGHHIARVEDIAVSLNARPVPVRVYDPVPGQDATALIWFHGGGWVSGDLDQEDSALRAIASEAAVRIYSVDYRLAPEHPFPAAIGDGVKVYKWLLTHKSSERVSKVYLGGVSSGANLAIAVSLQTRDHAVETLAGLVLICGAYVGDATTASYQAYGDGRFGLSASAMENYWQLYASSSMHHPLVTPVNADLTGLPPVFLGYAELDILRDDSLLLKEKLEDAGVQVTPHQYAGAIHGFTQYFKVSEIGRAALLDACLFLRAGRIDQ